MTDRLNDASYRADIERIAGLPLPWDKLTGKVVAISGATGMIGATLIDVLMYRNSSCKQDCHIIALGRSRDKALRRLPYFDCASFRFDEIDICGTPVLLNDSPDYLIHLASSTHPKAYASNPVGTIKANIYGLDNMLSAANRSKREGKLPRLLFASSVEVYGENRGDVELFDEHYSGYIDCNTLRACYTESKRLGESLCQAYKSQFGIDSVIARIARVYGETLLPDDTKALSQFMHRALEGKDVVLKSAGTQRFSYLHVSDAVSGLLYTLLRGESGEAYNLASKDSNISLKELAGLIAAEGNVKVVHDLPSDAERAGYSKATIALMDSGKANSLGWRAHYDIAEGIHSTMMSLKGAC